MPETYTQTPDELEALAPDAEEAVEQDADPAKDNAEFQTVLKDLCKHFIGQDKWARRQEVIDARRQRFYWRGDQYIYIPPNSDVFRPLSSASSSAVDMPRYTDVYNIFTPYGESLISVGSQNPPGVNFQPDDLMKASDVSAAKAAEKYKEVIDRANDRKHLQSEVWRLFYTDGRTTLYTHSVEDEETEEQTELIEAFGVLETKCPVTSRDLKGCPYYFISGEIDLVTAKAENPDVADEIKTGSSAIGESSYERIARLGVLQGGKTMMQAGDAFSHLVTQHHAWLRPAAFQQAPDAYKERLKNSYPSGCYVKFCGEAFCCSRNESMDDHLAVNFPTPGDGMSRASLGKRMVPLQDTFNDSINLMKESHDYCIPITYMDSELGDIDALREQISEPGNHASVKRPANLQSLADAFFTESPSQIPATLPEFIIQIGQELAQFITGALPALLGQGEANNKTLGGIQVLRDAALGRLGLSWGAMQELYATAYWQAARCAANNRDEDAEVTIPPQGRNGAIKAATVSIADLKNGNFHCFPDTDSSFPETTNAKRTTFMGLLTGAETNPLLAEIMAQPDNQELGRELIGLQGLQIPGAESRNKQLGEIEQLLQEGPIPPSAEQVQVEKSTIAQAIMMAAQHGIQAPPPPQEGQIIAEMTQPSIAVDPQFDNHKYEYEEGARWMNSEERRDEEKRGNQAGVQNVKLHLMQHFKLLQSQAPPPMPLPQGKGAPAPIAAPNAGAQAPVGLQ